jgi:hypothetical protein
MPKKRTGKQMRERAGEQRAKAAGMQRNSKQMNDSAAKMGKQKKSHEDANQAAARIV